MEFQYESDPFEIYVKETDKKPDYLGTNFVADDEGKIYEVSPSIDRLVEGYDVLVRVRMVFLKEECILQMLKILQNQDLPT